MIDRLTASCFMMMAALALWVPAGSAGATGQWSQYRGPERTGVADQPGLLRAWPEEGPTELWRRPLGEGFSGIVVAGELLYTLYALDEDDFVAAFRVADGSEVWRRRIGAKFYDEWGNGPRSTPIVDGDLLYAVSTRGLLVALDRKSGELRWQLDMESDYPAIQALPRLASVMPPDENIDATEFGHSSSPLIEGDLLVVHTGHGRGRSLIALDKRTGEVRWSALDNPAGHSSPLATTLHGRRQIVSVLHDELVAVGAGGEPLWSFPLGWTATQPIPVPPNKILVNATYDIGAALLALHREGESWSVEPVWRNRLLRHAWSSPVVHEGHVYGFDHATLRCLDLATGDIVWGKRGLGKATIVLADGLLIILGDRGKLHLAEADSEGFRQTGEARIFEGQSWTAPSLAGGKLLVRNHQEMVAFDLRGAGSRADGPSPAATVAGVAQSPADRSAEEVTSRAIAALGGRDGWQALDTLELAGTHTSFSFEDLPFRIQRRRPNLYRFEFSDSTHPTVIGHDGEQSWWHRTIAAGNQFRTWPVPATLPWAKWIAGDVDFDPPFLAAAERGHSLDYLGPSVFEGTPVYGYQLTLANGHVQRWYVDAESFLPHARVESVFYVIIFQEKRTYFSDYRELSGVMIPYQVEQEFGNEHRIMKVAEARANVDIDPRAFRLPPPAGMEKLRSLAGHYQVTARSLVIGPTPEWAETETSATLQADFDGALLEEEMSVVLNRVPLRVRRLFSYDRFRDVYRLAQFDNGTAHLDVYEGGFDDDGRLVMTNVDSGTPWEDYRGVFHSRQILYDWTDDGFKVDVEVSADGGKTWNLDHGFAYTRAEEASAAPAESAP